MGFVDRVLLAAFFLGLFINPPSKAGAQAPSSTARTLAPGAIIGWSAERNPHPVTYRSGEITITIRRVRAADSVDLWAPYIVIQAPGRAAQLIEGSPVWSSSEHLLGVGSLDRQGTPFVYLQSYTGGAHCCNAIQVAVVEPTEIRIIELGQWDGGPDQAFPRDEDGDGMVDFVQHDGRFLYLFSSYAESMAPPRVLNIVDGRRLDVSSRAGFRHLFVQAAQSSRRNCVERGYGGNPNGACAAYAASAARAGSFEVAWPEILSAFNPADWDLPTGCRVAQDPCPASAEIRFRNYPDALRHLLREWGYLPN